MRAALLVLLLGACATTPESDATIWIPLADAAPELRPDVDVRVPIEAVDDAMAPQARVRSIELRPACEAALRWHGRLADCVGR